MLTLFRVLAGSGSGLSRTRTRSPTASARGSKKKQRRQIQAVKLTPRGAPDGPKRTPLNVGDAWQNQRAYEVEEVSPLFIV